ncbi:hypothetical protein ACVB8X_39840 [Streptomyces sp. NRAIS4]
MAFDCLLRAARREVRGRCGCTGLGVSYPSGAQPDLLRPALEAAGVIAPQDSIDDLLGDDKELSPLEAKRKALQVIGEYFGLALSRQ